MVDLVKKQTALLACSRYPHPSKAAHFVNMMVNGSIVETCSECGHKVYVSTGGQAVLNDTEKYNPRIVCMECLAANHDQIDTAPTMHPAIKKQLQEVMSSEEFTKLEEEIPTLRPQDFLDQEALNRFRGN